MASSLTINGGSSSIKFALFQADRTLRRILLELSSAGPLVRVERGVGLVQQLLCGRALVPGGDANTHAGDVRPVITGVLLDCRL